MRIRGYGRKIISAALCFCMAVLLLPAVALAASDPALDISGGSISLKQSGSDLQYKQGSGAWTAYTGTLVISGSTTSNTLSVTSGSHTVKFNAITIDVSGTDNASAVSHDCRCSRNGAPFDFKRNKHGEIRHKQSRNHGL